jgi:hypothetical protein
MFISGMVSFSYSFFQVRKSFPEGHPKIQGYGRFFGPVRRSLPAAAAEIRRPAVIDNAILLEYDNCAI